MKKTDFLYFIGIGILALCILLVIIFKFVLKPQDSFGFINLNQIYVTDLNGKEAKLTDFFRDNESTYCLIFDLNDCFSCIYRGLEDIKHLKSKWKFCLGVVIHDYIEEVKGWASNYEFSPFLMLKRIDFFEHIKSAKTPVFVKINKGKVVSYRYITAN